MGRAERRRRTEIKKTRAKKQIYASTGGNLFPEHYKTLVGIHTNTPQVCSCRTCGNQRQYEGITRSEKKSLDSHKIHDQ